VFGSQTGTEPKFWCPLLDSNQHGPLGPRDFKSDNEFRKARKIGLLSLPLDTASVAFSDTVRAKSDTEVS